MRILVVDDDRDMLQLVSIHFKRGGYTSIKRAMQKQRSLYLNIRGLESKSGNESTFKVTLPIGMIEER